MTIVRIGWSALKDFIYLSHSTPICVKQYNLKQIREQQRMHLYNHTEKLLYNCYCNFSIPVIALHKVQTTDITVNGGLGEYSSFCMGDWIYCYEVTCFGKRIGH